MTNSNYGRVLSAVLLSLTLAACERDDDVPGDGIGRGPADEDVRTRSNDPTVNDTSHPYPPAYAVSDRPVAPAGSAAGGGSSEGGANSADGDIPAGNGGGGVGGTVVK